MSIKVGGIYVSGLSTRAANDVCKELRGVAGTPDFDDYVVDLCFMTYVPLGLGAEHAAGIGIQPGMVGRKQRRFIINLEVPPTLVDRESCAMWITHALERSAEIVRDYLPRKGRLYPAERLAGELDSLRALWADHLSQTA